VKKKRGDLYSGIYKISTPTEPQAPHAERTGTSNCCSGKIMKTQLALVVWGCSAAKERDCVGCTSTKESWKRDECKRFSLVAQAGSLSTGFEGRHGHACVVFPQNYELALWVIGGRGERYRKWNFQRTSISADVWFSIDGVKFFWNKYVQLFGDFSARTSVGFLMENVLDPGDTAPFWERYGHTVNVLRVIDVRPSNAHRAFPAMVVCGGFTPSPNNDAKCSVGISNHLLLFLFSSILA